MKLQNTKHALFLIAVAILLIIPGAYAQQILLPIEVLGEEGTQVQRTINLTATQANRVAKLWMQVNNLTYDNKASVKINNGAWYDLSNESVEMHHQEKARGGMTHAGFNTIRFSIPANDFEEGNNTIRFRFNQSDGISIGYRVVRFNLLDSNDDKVIDKASFREEDPDVWKAPEGYDDEQSVAAGKELWYNKPLWNHYLTDGRKGNWYGQSLPARRTINAKCTSCHTRDGRDLEIFSYSNLSIVERSKFHGLSAEEGRQIAAYIRSLSGTSPTSGTIGRYGRSWNPPYQPGPQLKDKPIEQWAAGAGLDAVLDNDSDMAAYLFPNGINQQTVSDRFDTEKSFDRTEIPLAIQFPDWKHWLPKIHPMDAYTKNNYWNVPHQRRNSPDIFYPKGQYEKYRDFLENNAASASGEELLKQQRDFWWNYRGFLAINNTKGGDWAHWRTRDGAATASLGDGISRELAATSLAKLMAVQNFELVNEFELQDKSNRFVSEENRAIDHPQKRQWFGRNYNVFEIPPHFQACVGEGKYCNRFTGQPKETGFFESTVWYQLQMVLNAGEGMMSGNSPVDYNYHPDFIVKASNSSGIDEPLRYYHSMNVMYQTRTWSGGKDPSSGKGFRMRVMGPWHIYGISDGNQFSGYEAGEFAKTLENVKPGMTAMVMNALLEEFLDELDKDYNAIENFSYEESDNGLGAREVTYQDIIIDVERTENKIGFFYKFAAKMYFYIPKFKELGVDCALIDRWTVWCSKAWPNIKWEELQCGSVPTDQKVIVKIAKENAQRFVIDGGGNFGEAKNVYLYNDIDGEKQQWIEIDRGNGYFSYRLSGSNQCVDIGDDRIEDDKRSVIRNTCSKNNERQQWRKIEIAPNIFRLENRNFSEFSLDGGEGGENFQRLGLYPNDNTNKNQHWVFTVVRKTPEMHFTQLREGSSFNADINLEIFTDIIPNGHTINNVQLYLNDALIRQENSSPFTWGIEGQNDAELADMTDGDYTLKAVLTYGDNLTLEESVQFKIRQRELSIEIPEIEILTDIRLYPNPVETKLSIDGLVYSHTYTITLLDIRGKKHQVLMHAGSSMRDVDVSNLSGGMYLVRVTSDSQTKVFKFTKR